MISPFLKKSNQLLLSVLCMLLTATPTLASKVPDPLSTTQVTKAPQSPTLKKRAGVVLKAVGIACWQSCMAGLWIGWIYHTTKWLQAALIYSLINCTVGLFMGLIEAYRLGKASKGTADRAEHKGFTWLHYLSISTISTILYLLYEEGIGYQFILLYITPHITGLLVSILISTLWSWSQKRAHPALKDKAQSAQKARRSLRRRRSQLAQGS